MRSRFLMPVICRPANAFIVAVVVASAESLREKIAAEADRAQALVDLAAEEDRDLTDAEKTEIDGILGVGDPKAKDYKPGSIDALQRDLARVERLEARQAELAQARGGTMPFARANGPQRTSAGAAAAEADTEIRAAKIVVPRDAMFQHGRLQAFQGQHARQEAYLVGQFLLATLWNHQPAAKWCGEHGIDTTFRAALSGGNNPLGGFLVPTEMESGIILLREAWGVFRRNAEVVPMASDTKDHPISATDLEATFAGENTELDESDPTWGNARLVAKKIGAIVRHSTELAEDAIISIADALTQQFARAFAKKEDNCGYNGDGTGTYGGIVGLANALNAGSIHTAAAGNVNFGTLDLEDFEAVIGKLPEYAGSDPKWHVSKSGWANAMLRLQAAAGGNTVETLAGGVRTREFLGYPVEIAQVLPQALTGTTSTVLAYFGDLRMAAVLGNRRGISIMLSDQRYFEYDQIGIKGTERFDIVVHSTGSATEAGAIVALKTPAA